MPKKTKIKATKKRPSKRKKLSVKEEKLLVVATLLDEIFHIASHSIEDGTEATTPLEEIIMAATFLHNEMERDDGHKIKDIKVICECEEGEHSLSPKDMH